MQEAARKKRNEEKLIELYPSFRARIKRTIQALEAAGLRPRIQEAWRSPEAQRAAYESGHSKLLFGFHNVTGLAGNPEALAVDMLDDNAPLNPGKAYLLHLAAAAEKTGLMTGIRWGVPASLVSGIDAAIAAADWSAAVKVGWDPTHIQPVGMTAGEARSGTRPA
jgi:hypothetical protein